MAEFMNEKQYFTATERKEFLKVYRSLFATARPLIGEKEFFFLRQHITEAVLSGSYLRDSNGINRLYHDIATALILSQEVGLDRSTLAAVLTCNLVVENRLSFEAVENLFGTDCVKIIRGLIKANSLYAKQETVQSDNFRNLLLTFAEDVRVIIIMIADRLCLMRMINHHPNNRFRENVAYEASYLYAPLAHRLGLYRIKTELEDLALKYTQREEYDRIAHKLSETKESRDKYIREFIAPIKEKLATAGLKFEIKGRVKSISSILNKIRKQNVDIEGIYDLFAIRVVLDTPPENESADCWHVYSIITDMYRPNPKRLKDWLSVPKSNGYESLHITVWGPEDRWVEVQIRTKRMDEIAERGLAAHWKYKEASNGGNVENQEEEKLSWLRQILEWQQDMSDNKEFLNAIKSDLDMFSDSVYCFTPTGDVKALPSGSTPIDFAYSIHTAVGNKMVGARVNGKLVNIDYVIQNGDRIEVMTSQNSKGPSRDWLNIVKSTQAKNKINQWFRSELKEENIVKGKELIAQYCKAKSINLTDINKPEYQSKVMRKYGFHDWDSALATLGHGGLKEGQVVNKMLEEYRKDHPIQLTDEDVLNNVPSENKDKAVPQKSKSGIIVKGLYDVAVHFSKCCSPVPGDEIVGFVTRGRGVSIHRTDCINIMNLSELEKVRLIDAEWQQGAEQGDNGLYLAEIKIFGNNRTGLLVDITRIFTEREIDISSINSKTSKQGVATISISFNTKGKEELSSLIEKIRQVESVIDIERTTG